MSLFYTILAGQVTFQNPKYIACQNSSQILTSLAYPILPYPTLPYRILPYPILLLNFVVTGFELGLWAPESPIVVTIDSRGCESLLTTHIGQSSSLRELNPGLSWLTGHFEWESPFAGSEIGLPHGKLYHCPSDGIRTRTIRI